MSKTNKRSKSTYLSKLERKFRAGSDSSHEMTGLIEKLVKNRGFHVLLRAWNDNFQRELIATHLISSQSKNLDLMEEIFRSEIEMKAVYDVLINNPAASGIFEKAWEDRFYRTLSTRALVYLRSDDLSLMRKLFQNGSGVEAGAVYDGLKNNPEATPIFEDSWNCGIHPDLSARFLARHKAHDLDLMEKIYMSGSEGEARSVYAGIKGNPASVTLFVRALDEEKMIETSSRHLLEAIAAFPSRELPTGIENTLEFILLNDSIPDGSRESAGKVLVELSRRNLTVLRSVFRSGFSLSEAMLALVDAGDAGFLFQQMKGNYDGIDQTQTRKYSAAIDGLGRILGNRATIDSLMKMATDYQYRINQENISREREYTSDYMYRFRQGDGRDLIGMTPPEPKDPNIKIRRFWEYLEGEVNRYLAEKEDSPGT